MKAERIKKLKKAIALKEKDRMRATTELRKLESCLYGLQMDPKMQKMVGRCFKYRNSFGHDCPGWWLYVKVIGYKPRDRSLLLCRYERTSHRGINVVPTEETFSIEPLKHHLFQIPITVKQFDANINNVIKELEKMKGTEQ